MSQPGPWILRVFKPKRIYLHDGRLPLDDLAFLARHAKTVRELWVEGEGWVDVAAIHALTELESLIIRASALPAALELNRFPKLNRLIMDLDGAPQLDWDGVGPLELIKLNRGGERDAEAISALPRLREVHLDYSVVPDRFLGPVEELNLESPSRLPAEPIGGLGTMTSLMLAGVPVEDLRLFSEAAELEFLGVVDARHLVSLAGVRMASSEAADLWLEDCPVLSDLADVVEPVDTEIKKCPRLAWQPRP